MFPALKACRTRWERMMVVATTTTVLSLSGCSFLLLDRPSQYKSGEKTTCTTSNALPGVDTGFALLHLVSLGVLASASGDAFGGAKSRSTLAQLDVTWLIMHGASAGWGYSWVSECKELVGDDAGFTPRPVRATPRPRPRPIPPPANASSPQPAQPTQPTQPVQPASAAPAAAPPALVPQAPRVPQQVDDE